MIPELRALENYEERLKKWGLTTLETRRLIEDQFEVLRYSMGIQILIEICFSHSRKIIELEDMW